MSLVYPPMTDFQNCGVGVLLGILRGIGCTIAGDENLLRITGRSPDVSLIESTSGYTRCE